MYPFTLPLELMFRALSVGLVAVTAVVAGLVVNRSRQSSPPTAAESEPAAADEIRLDALRKAGF